MEETAAAVDASPGMVAGEAPSSRRAAIVLVLLLLACACAFALVARDAGIGRPGDPAPARPDPVPADAPRLVSDVPHRPSI